MKHVLVMAVVATSAWAGGAVDVALPPDVAALVRHQVTQAREVNPRAFDAVRAVQAQLPAVDAKKRGRFAPVAPRLNAVPHATWALVEALVVSGSVEGATTSARVAWQVGLLESLGGRREAAVEPVLLAVVKSEQGPEVTRAAAEALGRLGTDAATTALVSAAAESSGERRVALYAGMGSCRRVAVAEFLARQLGASTSEAEQLALITSLSAVANAWALATPAGAPVKAEVPQLQAIAARALTEAQSRSSGVVRQNAHDALAVVSTK